MPIHDWTRVYAGIFHDFHHEWISTIKHSLNSGLLPPDHYALAEQFAGGRGPDVLTLQLPDPTRPVSPIAFNGESLGGIALADTPPRVWWRGQTELDIHAIKAKVITIRHINNHRVVAVLEIVSPGNKNSLYGLPSFVEKAEELLRAGIHLLVVDLFPPGPRDPQGIHKAIWDEFTANQFALPTERPLTLAAYIGGPIPEAFVEPTQVGAALADMPLFLTAKKYVPVPLESTYQFAWEAVPAYWRSVLAGNSTPA